MPQEPQVPLRRILAANASPMTGPGTTTFLLGQGAVVAIDPGPADPAHLAAILAALQPGEQLAAILVTHPHLDHSALAPELARATGAPVLGYGPAGSGRSTRMQALTALGLPQGAEGVDTQFSPDRRLQDGMQLQIGGLQISVLHTPGHMAEHLCFGVEDQLFCGDLVMAWAPSLVSPPEGDMRDYLNSLSRLAEGGWRRLLPTHGDVIENPAARIAELRAHRLARESQLLEVLKSGPARLPDLVSRIYFDTDQRLWPAASRNILAHLIDLIERGQILATPWPATDSLYSLA